MRLSTAKYAGVFIPNGADVGRGQGERQALRPRQGTQAHRGPVAHELERAAPVVGEVERDVADLGAGAVRTRVAQNVEAERVALVEGAGERVTQGDRLRGVGGVGHVHRQRARPRRQIDHGAPLREVVGHAVGRRAAGAGAVRPERSVGAVLVAEVGAAELVVDFAGDREPEPRVGGRVEIVVQGEPVGGEGVGGAEVVLEGVRPRVLVLERPDVEVPAGDTVGMKTEGCPHEKGEKEDRPLPPGTKVDEHRETPESVTITRHDLAAVPGAEGGDNPSVRLVLEEVDRTVGEQRVHAPRVLTRQLLTVFDRGTRVDRG